MGIASRYPHFFITIKEDSELFNLKKALLTIDQ